MTTIPEPITLQAVLKRHGITTVKELQQRTGLSKQHAWGLMRATIGVGKVAAKRLHETLHIPFEELLAVAQVPARRPRAKARSGRTPRRERPAPAPVVEAAPSMLSPQARKAALVARCRQMKAEGRSLQAIAAALNAEGVPTISGRGTWQAGTIGNLLKEGA